MIGYAVFILALLHAGMSMSDAGRTNVAGIWFASIAFAGLGLQTFVGMNLQAPGAYRSVLRRWHTLIFWAVTLLALGHVLLNGAF